MYYILIEERQALINLSLNEVIATANLNHFKLLIWDVMREINESLKI